MKSENRDLLTILVILKFWPIMFAIIAIIGIFKSCTAPEVDKIDTWGKKYFRSVGEVLVMDSTGNGFTVIYGSREPVTCERAKEMLYRQSACDAQEKLSDRAPKIFKQNLTDLDIFEFGKYAAKYDVNKDIVIMEIRIFGDKKRKMYERPNPKYPELGEMTIGLDRKGEMFISGQDLYGYLQGGRKLYQYYNCMEASNKDEKFTHCPDFSNLSKDN